MTTISAAILSGRFRNKARAVVLILVLFSFCAGTVSALTSDLVSTEITVFLRPDGKAEIFWQMEWNVSAGDMSGFYFQGEECTPVWNLQRSYADLPGGIRHPLEIKNMGGGKYDIILAGRKRFSGRAYYSFNYACDAVSTGHVGYTEAADLGKLVYFDWAPAEWDEGMEYRLVRLVLPVAVSGETLSAAEKETVRMYTEEWVNAANKIDYEGVAGEDGRWYLGIMF